MKRRFFLDIEVDWDRVDPFKLVIQKGSSPIQMIGCYDSYKKKFYSFFFHKKIKINKKDYYDKKGLQLYETIKKRFKTPNFNIKDSSYISEKGTKYPCRYMYFKSERVMLRSFMQFVWDVSPDIYGGFFIETFDLLYIINRCKKLNVSSSYLSPLKEAYVSHGQANIRGSVIYDIPKTYAKFMGSHRHQNSLKKLSETHLNEEQDKKINKTSDNILDEDWYDNDWKKFIKYCLVDVELCILLEERLGLIDMAEKIVNFTGLNPKFITFTSNVIVSFWSFIKPIYEKEVLNNNYKIAFATKKRTSFDKAVGAIVLESKKGLYTEGVILILDLVKMYPKIIETLNISIETYRSNVKEQDKNNYIYSKENDVYFVKDTIGFVPFSLKLLYKIRTNIEKERDVFEYGTKEWNEMNDKRQTIKDTINAVSGQFDYGSSIVLEPQCANSIRLTGQKILLTSRDYAERLGKVLGINIKIIYGDTDSIFIYLPDVNDTKTAELLSTEICEWIKEGYNEYAKSLNLESHQFDIDLEKIMDVFVSIGKKKKYFGHTLWSDGHNVKEENSFYIKGFESRRSDSSEFTGKAQKEIFGLINETRKIGWKKTRHLIMKKLRLDYPKEFSEENVLEIGIPKKLNKSFKSYKVKNPWLEGCIYANEHLKANFDIGSKPKLLYIKRVNNSKNDFPSTDMICVEEGMTIPKNIFIIDKEKMMKKTIFNKIESVLEVCGIDIDEINTGKKQKKLDDYGQINTNNDQKSILKENKIVDENNINEYIKTSKIELKRLKKENAKI